jgi:hypothetical protein
MSMKRPLLAALALLALATPVAAQDHASRDEAPEEAALADGAPPSAAAKSTAAPSSGPSAACGPKPAEKGHGLGGLLAAANRVGAGDLLRNQAGPLFGSSKGGAIAGAVLGTALSAANAEEGHGGYSGGYPGGSSAMMGVGGDRDAQIAAVATGAVIGLARSQAAHASASASACGSKSSAPGG